MPKFGDAIFGADAAPENRLPHPVKPPIKDPNESLESDAPPYPKTGKSSCNAWAAKTAATKRFANCFNELITP